MPFSPVQRARKFSAVFGTFLPKSPIVIRPDSVSAGNGKGERSDTTTNLQCASNVCHSTDQQACRRYRYRRRPRNGKDIVSNRQSLCNRIRSRVALDSCARAAPHTDLVGDLHFFFRCLNRGDSEARHEGDQADESDSAHDERSSDWTSERGSTTTVDRNRTTTNERRIHWCHSSLYRWCSLPALTAVDVCAQWERRVSQRSTIFSTRLCTCIGVNPGRWTSIGDRQRQQRCNHANLLPPTACTTNRHIAHAYEIRDRTIIDEQQVRKGQHARTPVPL
jgi:hypothetical protein